MFICLEKASEGMLKVLGVVQLQEEKPVQMCFMLEISATHCQSFRTEHLLHFNWL